MKPHYWLVTYKCTQTQNAMSYNEGYCAMKSLNTGKPLLDEIREYLPIICPPDHPNIIITSVCDLGETD